jgi:hypothetical protein
VKQREGVIGNAEKPNAVLNKLAVAKQTSTKAKLLAGKPPGSRK